MRTGVNETLPGIQVTCRCAAWDGRTLCDQPAPFLINGTGYCREHAGDIQARSAGKQGGT